VTLAAAAWLLLDSHPSSPPALHASSPTPPRTQPAQARAEPAAPKTAEARSESAGEVIERSGIAPSASRDDSSVEAAHERALTLARNAEAQETMDRAQVQALLADSFALMLPERRFSDADYEAMTDAVLNIRAARRALAALPLSEGSARVVASEHTQLTNALAELERITGVNPSAYPDVLDPGAGISRDDDANEKEVVHEPLSNYPPRTPPATAAPRP